MDWKLSCCCRREDFLREKHHKLKGSLVLEEAHAFCVVLVGYLPAIMDTQYMHHPYLRVAMFAGGGVEPKRPWQKAWASSNKLRLRT
jgi:hypothetical protein